MIVPVSKRHTVELLTSILYTLWHLINKELSFKDLKKTTVLDKFKNMSLEELKVHVLERFKSTCKDAKI
jgi:hypothetical protein